MKKSLEQLVKEEKRAYFKQWRQNNGDKVKKHQDDYWKRRVERKLNEQEVK